MINSIGIDFDHNNVCNCKPPFSNLKWRLKQVM